VVWQNILNYFDSASGPVSHGSDARNPSCGMLFALF